MSVLPERQHLHDVYTLSYSGKTWNFASHTAYGAGLETVDTGNAAIWEPFFLHYHGKLIAYFSDQRDSAHSQKLSLSSTSDLKTWSASSDVVAQSDPSARSGMAVVSYIPTTKRYMLSHEYCNRRSNGCVATYRLSKDPTACNSAADKALVSNSSYQPGGSPQSAWYGYPGSSNGAVDVSTNSDTNLFVYKDNAQTRK